MRSDSGYLELVRSIRDNHSLQLLDLSKNNLSQATIAELFASMQENWVLSEVRIEVKGKNAPF